MSKVKNIQLNNGIEIPQMGMGVFQITNQEACERSVSQALETGYRLIDTAACYGNEKAVGSAVHKSNIAREKLFLTSKVWIQDSGFEKTRESFLKTLGNLQTEYLDLYLIHMPYGDYHGSWRAMEELYREGKIRAIGVCNFQTDRLADLVLSHEICPAVNQIEMHPFCQQNMLREFMKKYDIKTMAWAPFAEGKRGLFNNQILFDIGNKYGKTPAQVVLRWLRQQNIISIPKSAHKERIEENYAIEDFELSEEDMTKVEKMDTGRSLILEIDSLSEVYRLHSIRF